MPLCPRRKKKAVLLVTVCFVRRTTGAVFQGEAVTSLYATVPLGCHAVAGVCHVYRLIELQSAYKLSVVKLIVLWSK